MLGMQKFPIMDLEAGSPLFYPHIPTNVKKYGRHADQNIAL
jgi:hypothetical protein